MEILLIEDDAAIGKAVHQGLGEAGHVSRWVTDGKVGLEQAMSQRFDAIVLDLLLPGLSGLDLLEKLRQSGVKTPVIILTALGSVDDRVLGLKKGADDYLIKPFAMAELLARVEALQRRSGQRPSPVIQAGDLRLDLSTRRVALGGSDIELTPTGFEVIEEGNAGFITHSNHFLCGAHACPANYQVSLPDSFPRYERMKTLVAGKFGSLTVADLRNFLADHDGAPTSICRHPHDGPDHPSVSARGRTAAALIAEPAQGRLHACKGNPCTGKFVTYELA